MAGAYVSGLVSVAVLAAVIPFASSAGAGSATAGGALAGGTVAAGTSVSMVGPAVQAFQHVAVLTHYTKFNLVAPIAIEALGIFDVFNLWMQEASTNSSFHSTHYYAMSNFLGLSVRVYCLNHETCANGTFKVGTRTTPPRRPRERLRQLRRLGRQRRPQTCRHYQQVQCQQGTRALSRLGPCRIKKTALFRPGQRIQCRQTT